MFDIYRRIFLGRKKLLATAGEKFMLPHFGVGGNDLLLVLHRLWAAGSVHGHQLLKGYRFLLKEFFILPPIPSLIKILQKPAYLAPK